jgi:hypothetical protein
MTFCKAFSQCHPQQASISSLGGELRDQIGSLIAAQFHQDL